LVSIVDREFEFAFFGPEDDGLPFHAADQVEGGLGLSAQRQLQQVVLEAGFEGVTQRGGNFKEAIRRAKTFDALMGPLVIVIFDPEPDPFAGGIETVKLGAGEELLPERFPEPLDFAERHGMVGARLEVVGAILFHLGLEAGRAAPVDELPAVVREHFFGRLVFPGGDPKHFQHVFGGVAAKQIRPHDEARIIVHERDDVGITAAQPEGEDVGLPHLVGRRALEEAGAGHIAGFAWWGRAHPPGSMEMLAHGLRTGGQQEDPLEQLGDSFDAPGGFFLFEAEDLVPDGLRQLGAPAWGRRFVL